MTSESELLSQAIEAFNYPEEMGEYVHDSVEALAELLVDLPEGGHAHKVVAWLHQELSKGYAVEAGMPNAVPPHSLARYNVKTQELSAYSHDNDTWNTIVLD